MSVEVIPAPTDPYELLHWNMIRAHGPFKIGYERVTSLLQDPPMDDLANFLGYIDAWAQSIVVHHDTEEASVFPFLAQKMDIHVEKEQHKVIHAGLTTIIDYLAACKRDHAQFSAEKLLSLMQGVRDPLFEHLDHEVSEIAAEKMRAAGWTEAELNKMLASLTTAAHNHGNPFLLVPFMMGHTPPEHKSFPIAPWIIKKVVVPYIMAWPYSGYWKWCPYALS